MICGKVVLQTILIRAEPGESHRSVVLRAEESFLEIFPVLSYSKDKKIELRFSAVSISGNTKIYTFEVTAEVEMNEDSAIAELHKLCTAIKKWAGRPTKNGAANLLELAAIAESKYPKK